MLMLFLRNASFFYFSRSIYASQVHLAHPSSFFHHSNNMRRDITRGMYDPKNGTTEKRANMLYNWPGRLRKIVPVWTPTPVMRIVDLTGKAAFLPIAVAFVAGLDITNGQGFQIIKEDLSFEKWYEGDREWKSICAEEHGREPCALPTRRRRQSLSLPSTKTKPRPRARKQKTYNQLQSPLLRLPEEIRCMIYAYLVPGKRFHVQQSYRRFGYIECLLGGDLYCRLPHECIKDQLDRTKREPTAMPYSRLVLSQHHLQPLKYKPLSLDVSIIPKCELLALAKICRIA
jgi:hypothetical protein